MSEVKRYNPELEKDIGLGLPCLSMFGNPYGEWVHYQDYAELKAQRDALADKNASMMALAIACEKEFGSYTVEEFPDDAKVSYPEERCNITFGMIRQALNKTATDAWLNSVRADAVASFAHHQRVIADSETDPTIQRGHRITACRAEDFAAQLRAGKDGE